MEGGSPSNLHDRAASRARCLDVRHLRHKFCRKRARTTKSQPGEAVSFTALERSRLNPYEDLLDAARSSLLQAQVLRRWLHEWAEGKPSALLSCGGVSSPCAGPQARNYFAQRVCLHSFLLFPYQSDKPAILRFAKLLSCTLCSNGASGDALDKSCMMSAPTSDSGRRPRLAPKAQA